MIQIIITQTHKYIGQVDYQVYNEETKNFKGMTEAKDYLKKKYGNCKRENMYHDDYPGKVVGYIYSTKSYPASYGDKHGYNHDWVDFHKVTRITL